MGRRFFELLDGDVYACRSCRTHLASRSSLVSKQFHSKSGRAYLFATACNMVTGPHEERMMTTGMHIVCDTFCAQCLACVGWQYICAFEKSQKYKEGKFILERAMVVDFDKSSGMYPRPGSAGSSGGSPGSDAGRSGSTGSMGVPPYLEEESEDEGV